MYFELFPKKKDDFPAGNLRKLVEAFNTLEDPTLQFKRSSMKRGAEATIALSMLHGEEIDWVKVSSSLALGLAKMNKFFVEAKKYSQNLVELILPEPAPLTAAPSLSVPPTTETAPTEVA
jgi:hypothetical protein